MDPIIALKRPRGRPKKVQPMTDAPNMHETPEFKAAVAEQVAALIAPLLKQMEDARPNGGVRADDQNWAQSLAMTLAELNDQGTGRKRVAPEVLRARAEAREEMVQMIILAREDGLKPTYTLRNKIYLDEVLVDPIYIDSSHKQRATEIVWPGVPNEAMVPANSIATDIFALFLKSIGSIVKPVVEAPMRVTAGGLVVHQGRERIAQENARPHGQAAGFGEGLKVNRRGTGGDYVETHVLGTVAHPAQQTA